MRKKLTTTIFKELAIKYEKYTTPFKGACSNVDFYGGEKMRRFFIKHFKPTMAERKRYGHYSIWWLSEQEKSADTPIKDYDSTNMRIMALLFADILWQENEEKVLSSRRG